MSYFQANVAIGLFFQNFKKLSHDLFTNTEMRNLRLLALIFTQLNVKKWVLANYILVVLCYKFCCA